MASATATATVSVAAASANLAAKTGSGMVDITSMVASTAVDGAFATANVATLGLLQEDE